MQREEYTVGWVCALPIERAAAEEMMDEEHGVHDNYNDGNIYSLGSMAGHNVVIVCLPSGHIGNNPAAAVTAQMRATFKGIRFGLMVGIGGGVPSAEVDIRLGDVVVSQPRRSFSGVVQYDYGKTTPSGFERTGSLNSPPHILLSAVANVQSKQIRGRSKLSEHLSKLSRIPRFQRDKAGPDVLFEAAYDHEGGLRCDKCKADKQVDRRLRESGEAVIHYGTIASGNQEMENAAKRDKVSADLGGILCFEREAAGIMNSFPCLVVRGICDYADSHKNDAWQPYAAAVAAAYGKTLLSVIPADKVVEHGTVHDAIDHEAVHVGQPYLNDVLANLAKKKRVKRNGQVAVAEDKWIKVMENRKEDGRCLNCGSGVHWESECLGECGKCLYRGHKASKCGFPVRCIKCWKQRHTVADCPDRSRMQDF
ncbi:nucleoside phosphorylase domain-containing protein [Phaeosphaeriaceae sp. PMI808]|nr:nucleoside phosphorylase domain-containing protein [Phaeosphaeriaceae sp. PMI808]